VNGEEYVFPQTPAEDPNFCRTGGLTKRELFAAMIFAADTEQLLRAEDAVEAADLLLQHLKRDAPPR
jgi:hypothetical protein